MTLRPGELFETRVSHITIPAADTAYGSILLFRTIGILNSVGD